MEEINLRVEKNFSVTDGIRENLDVIKPSHINLNVIWEEYDDIDYDKNLDNLLKFLTSFNGISINFNLNYDNDFSWTFEFKNTFLKVIEQNGKSYDAYWEKFECFLNIQDLCSFDIMEFKIKIYLK